MSHSDTKGGGQKGEAHWEVFLCVFNNPALLQRWGFLWHSTGFLSLVHARGTRLSLVLWHWSPGWPQNSTTAPSTGCCLWLLGVCRHNHRSAFSFQLLLYMHVSDKQSWLREYRYFCKGLFHLAATSDLHQSAPRGTFLWCFKS